LVADDGDRNELTDGIDALEVLTTAGAFANSERRPP
jgi:hypothetical protein